MELREGMVQNCIRKPPGLSASSKHDRNSRRAATFRNSLVHTVFDQVRESIGGSIRRKCFAVVFDRSLHDPFHRQRAYLHLNCDWHTVNRGAHVRAHRSEPSLKHSVFHVRLLSERIVDFEFASEVCFALRNGIFTREGVRVCEIVSCTNCSKYRTAIAAK
jgi:hypothetical protein